MRGLRTDKTAQVIIAGHTFVQNRRHDHYDHAVEAAPTPRIAAAFAGFARAI